MRKRRKRFLVLTVVMVLLVLGPFAWFLHGLFEGEKPRLTLEPLPKFFRGAEKFRLKAMDARSGLRSIRVLLTQEGRQMVLFEKEFPFEGLLNRGGVHEFESRFSADLSTLKLAQGGVDLEARVWDYSKRNGGDGNLTVLQHKMVVDTIPPAIRAVSRMHYLNMGGTGLVVYQVSSDTTESGVFVNQIFFKGFSADKEAADGLRVCYFAIPYDLRPNPELYLWAKDRAGNESRAGFYYRIRKRRFRTEKTNVSDRFLNRVLPYFSFYKSNPQARGIEKFLKINRELRRQNGLALHDLRSKTSPLRLWKGSWLRLKNAATMAKFADHRLYFYKGKKIDEEVHLGVDLASLAHSPVQAANDGRVIFADRLGIYGLSVVIDHGQGLASVYSHLSQADVKPGDQVTKGEVIGLTGQSGLAGGDHLHFAVMVGGVFVNPLEWWDPHWVRDNITRKLALAKQ